MLNLLTLPVVRLAPSPSYLNILSSNILICDLEIKVILILVDGCEEDIKPYMGMLYQDVKYI